MNCEQLKREDVEAILATVLKEFPVTELRFHIPEVDGDPSRGPSLKGRGH